MEIDYIGMSQARLLQENLEYTDEIYARSVTEKETTLEAFGGVGTRGFYKHFLLFKKRLKYLIIP